MESLRDELFSKIVDIVCFYLQYILPYLIIINEFVTKLRNRINQIIRQKT